MVHVYSVLFLHSAPSLSPEHKMTPHAGCAPHHTQSMPDVALPGENVTNVTYAACYPLTGRGLRILFRHGNAPLLEEGLQQFRNVDGCLNPVLGLGEIKAYLDPHVSRLKPAKGVFVRDVVTGEQHCGCAAGLPQEGDSLALGGMDHRSLQDAFAFLQEDTFAVLEHR